ncbi:MAG: AAA family ATPase [Rhodocyclales bacterium]|nr:AAA family ATPase [Rhodocyclales bacterium]
MTCSNCGNTLPVAAKFCPHCGTRIAGLVPEDGQRRHASIVFSDLSGYTALNERLDPEEVEAIMGRIKEAATRIIGCHGGVINQFIGDEVVALFGIPVARRDDAVRAVRAARELHAAVRAIGQEVAPRIGRALTMHSGINTGLIVARRSDSRDGHFALTGDTVNTGARLLGLAAADEVVIGPDTWREVGAQFSVRVGEPIEVKGKEHAITPYRIVGELAADPVARPSIVGRDAELRRFAALVAACGGQTQGQARGGVALVRGDPGIGKTRLVAEFGELAQHHGLSCHAAAVLDFSVGRGGDAMRNLMRSLLGIAADAGVDDSRRGLGEALAAGWVDGEQELFLCELLDIPPRPELRALDAALTGAVREQGARAAIDALVRAAALRRHLLLLVEDVHWATAASLEGIAALARIAAAAPLLLVLTTRIDGDPTRTVLRDMVREGRVTAFDLAPLAADSAVELASRFAGLDAGAMREIVERAEGNPLFLEQLLLNAGSSALAVLPGSIQALVLARMDQLPVAVRQMFQAAAVLGQRFSLAALRYLVADESCDCGELVARQLLRPAGADWLFSHALIRDGAYESLLKSRRRELHARAAEWFAARDPGLCAEHYELAGDIRAAGAYLAASNAEAQRYRYERAVVLAERGLALAREPGERHALGLMRARMLLDGGRAQEAIAAAGEALEHAATPAARAASLILQAAAMRILDRADAALAVLAEAEPLARSAGSDLDLARLHHLRGGFCFVLGRSADCLREHEAALAHARAAGSVEAEANALSGLGDASYVSGRMRSAQERFRICVELAQRHGLGRIEVANKHMLGWTFHYLGQLDQALAAGEDAVDMARRVSAPRTEAVARLTTAYTLGWLVGRLGPAFEHLDRALALAQGLGATRFEAENYVFRALLELRAGRREPALAQARDALAFCRGTAMDFIGPTALGVLAQITTDEAERQQALAEGEALLAQGSISHNHFDFHACAIDASLESRDYAAALRYCAALERYTAAEPIPWSDLAIARGRLLARHGRGEAGIEMRTALQALREQTARLGFAVWLPALDAAMAK